MAVKDITPQRQFTVELSVSGGGGFAIPGKWDMLSGSGQTTTSTETWPAGEKFPVRLQGPALPKQITVSRSYSPSRDDSWIIQMRELHTSVRITVVRSATNGNGDSVGSPTTYVECVVTDINDPAFDTSSGDASRIELVLQPSSIK